MFLILQVFLVLPTRSTTVPQSPTAAPVYTDYSSLWSRFFNNPGLQSQVQAYSSPVPSSKVSAQQQAYIYPSYTSSQLPQNLAYSYSQLVPSLQSLYQPSYNYTQLNASAAQAYPFTSSYPGLQSYYPSFSSLYAGVQPQSSASVASTATANKNALTFSSPAYTFQNGLGLYGQNQQYVYPGFPLSSYSQPYIQTGLPQLQQTSNNYGLNQGSTDTVNGFTPMKDVTSTTKPQTQYSESAKKQNNDDDYDETYSSKPTDNYKNTQTYKNHRPQYDDEEDGSEEYSQDKERPQYTRPSNEEDDDYEESAPSSYHTKNCNHPSGSASNHAPSFSDEDEVGIKNFAKQFKAFTKNEKYKSGDYSAESSDQKDHYNQPKKLKMSYKEDTYASSTKFKNADSPKTFHQYVYKAPEYSYKRTVDHFPKKHAKATSERVHVTSSPVYKDSVGHHSFSATVTTLKKYR